MKLYSTLSRTIETFSTEDGKVGMYVCGLTPYAPSHVGHAMQAVVFDVVRRYLEFKGYQVKHIQNFTDVDDKMIQAAKDTGISITELSEANIELYLKEMAALNVLPAHSNPRATKEMPKIIEMIKALEQKQYAYSTGGDVYFRVRSVRDYGKLSNRTLEHLIAGARVVVGENKEDPMDFALWKGKKLGEPAWDSPWGLGRPGWHIECSAMSLAYLGETIDIHGGGQDLIFPHHENEIVQSEAYTGEIPFARYWIHNGSVRLDEGKMSKSLGNVVSVGEILKRFSPDAIRLFFLGGHYRSPVEYNEKKIQAQERAVERLRHAVAPNFRTSGNLMDPTPYRDRFIEAMDNDLNTPQALSAIFDLVRDVNRDRDNGVDVTQAQEFLKKSAGLLGLSLKDPAEKKTDDIEPFVDMIVEIRSKLRQLSQYDLADTVRRKLEDQGVLLEDTSDGTTWRHAKS